MLPVSCLPLLPLFSPHLFRFLSLAPPYPPRYHSHSSPQITSVCLSLSVPSFLTSTHSAVSCNFSVSHFRACRFLPFPMFPLCICLPPPFSCSIYPPHLAPLFPSFHGPISVILCMCVCMCVWRLIAMPRSRCKVQGEGFG